MKDFRQKNEISEERFPSERFYREKGEGKGIKMLCREKRRVLSVYLLLVDQLVEIFQGVCE